MSHARRSSGRMAMPGDTRTFLKWPLIAGLFMCIGFVAGCGEVADSNQVRGLANSLSDSECLAQSTVIAREADNRAESMAPAGQPWFQVLMGTEPIIVSVPHATRPMREGSYRFADGGGTAALGIMLHRLARVTVISVTYESPSDPNYYDDNEYKRQLGELINKIKPIIVIDVHGSSPVCAHPSRS